MSQVDITITLLNILINNCPSHDSIVNHLITYLLPFESFFFFIISFRYRKEKADKKSQNELYFSSHTGKDAFVLDIKFERQLPLIQCISNADCLKL